MNIFGIIIICGIVLFTLLGGLIGALKGFTSVKSWGFEYVFVVLIGVPITGLVTSKTGAKFFGGFISVGIIILLIVAFMALFIILRKVFAVKIEKRKQLYYYEHYIENEHATAQILGAITVKDKKEYKQLLKQKNKRSAGVWGILNRVFGGVVLAFKGLVIAGFCFAVLLTLLDLTTLAADGGKLFAVFGKLYAGGAWKFFRSCIFDFLVIAVFMICIRCGYASGISSSLWGLIIIGLVAGAGVLAWYFAFKVEGFLTAANALNSHLGPKLEKASSVLGILKLTPLTVSKIIIAVCMFALLLVPVIFAGVFMPKLIDNARDGRIFRTADGVFGAIALTAFVLAIMLLIGAVTNSMRDAAFMSPFNAYFEKGKLATYFYDNNILQAMGVISKELPLTKWLK